MVCFIVSLPIILKAIRWINILLRETNGDLIINIDHSYLDIFLRPVILLYIFKCIS